MSDQFSPVVYLIKSVMCKWILTKKKFRSLNVDEIEVILPSNLTEDLFEEKKTSEKGCYSLIIQDIFCIKIQTFFNGFHHYSPYIDYSSINCVPQLAKKGVVVSDSPVPVAKNRYCMQIKHLDLKKKITKMLVLTW